MKTRFFFFSLLLLAACTPVTYQRIPAGGLPAYFRYQPGQSAKISAHRGGGDYAGYPENCLESFRFLAKRMPVIIECDINTTKDSVLLMLHDDVLDRTTTGKGRINEATYAYCRLLQLKDNQGNLTKYRMPTLDEVLTWGRGKITFTLDVKRNVPFEKVVAAVRRAGAADYAAVITYNATDAIRLHRLAPELVISVNIRTRADYERLREGGIPDDRMLAFVGTREAAPELYRFLHEKNIACILGTLGNLDKQAAAKGDSTYRTFVRNGADILSTDRPLEAGKTVNQE